MVGQEPLSTAVAPYIRVSFPRSVGGLAASKKLANAIEAVGAAAAEWKALWLSHPDQPRLEWAPSAEIEKPTVEAFRHASRQFKENTGLGMDTFHPRRVSQLSDETVSLLVDLLWKAECKGEVPDILAFILIHLIPKRGGGKRPMVCLEYGPSVGALWYKHGSRRSRETSGVVCAKVVSNISGSTSLSMSLLES